VVLLVSCWNRDQFPAELPLDPGLQSSPRQLATTEPDFTVRVNDIDYQVTPRYRYDLTGLVGSYRSHDSRFGLHSRWNDHVNVADICVVWSDNAGKLNLNALDFWNGQFTCNVETSDLEVWNQFKNHQLSNNHLLTSDEYLRGMIEEVRVGDQIRIRGWLADYRNDLGFSRGTSITREDRGNGACETIYVSDFEILESMENGWRSLFTASLLAVIGTALIWFVAVARGRF